MDKLPPPFGHGGNQDGQRGGTVQHHYPKHEIMVGPDNTNNTSVVNMGAPDLSSRSSYHHLQGQYHQATYMPSTASMMAAAIYNLPHAGMYHQLPYSTSSGMTSTPTVDHYFSQDHCHQPSTSNNV